MESIEILLTSIIQSEIIPPMRYPSNPELVISTEVVDDSGNNHSYSDRVAAIKVSINRDIDENGQFQFEIRDYPKKGEVLVIRASLPEITAAITSATLRREDSRD